MSKVSVCVKFRPLNAREIKVHGENTCIQSVDTESFMFKDEKAGDITFCFDRVFYQGSSQVEVYEVLAIPIVQDVISGINGTIIAYGQTGAGKTYSMEGPGILECQEQNKGLTQRVVDGLFDCIKSSDGNLVYTVNLSMVEIYMEKVRDLFDLSKDNLQIKEGKAKGIFLSGATKICIQTAAEALRCLSRGIANRAVGETNLSHLTKAEMNMASSRSHCMYIFSVQQESTRDQAVKTGKLMLVDLAGSEKVEKTGAEGKILEEAKTINKSLSALGNVINALTNGKLNHVPYRDSKLTRILQDALGGKSRTSLLCCCSPSSINASESLSTLHFGVRTKLIKTPPRVNITEEKVHRKQITSNPQKQESYDRIVAKLQETLKEEDVKLLEELFIMEGLLFDPSSFEYTESALKDVTNRTISLLQETVLDLSNRVQKLQTENKKLKAQILEANQVNDAKHWFTWRNMFGYMYS